MRSLTRKELQCLRLVAEGKNASEIAKELHMSLFTSRHYFKSVRRKLGCKSLAQAVYIAFRQAILP